MKQLIRLVTLLSEPISILSEIYQKPLKARTLSVLCLLGNIDLRSKKHKSCIPILKVSFPVSFLI